MRKNKRTIVKLEADDILSIIFAHYHDRGKDFANATGTIYGGIDDELRFVGVFGPEEDEEIFSVDLEEIDKNMDYNGDYSYLRKHPGFFYEKETD